MYRISALVESCGLQDVTILRAFYNSKSNKQVEYVSILLATKKKTLENTSISPSCTKHSALINLNFTQLGWILRA